MLDTKTIEIVKSTIPILENAGTHVTDYFYKRLFSAHPELKDIFNLSNQASGRQQFALFSAVAAYAKYIDNLGELAELVERIAQKHTSFDIQANHYPIVGHHLIETLKELAPNDFTEEVVDAWEKAYELLSSVLTGRERSLYEDKEQQIGGWIGPRRFRVKDKIKESELVTSYIFVPDDGGPILPYQPGQYTAVRVKPIGAENVEIRQYSLSDKSHPSHYRISVKKESSPTLGIVSNYLHDEVQVNDIIELMPPAGAFVLAPTENSVVLISGGVGITPMMAIIETLISDPNYEAPIFFLHTCKNNAQHSFKERLSEVSVKHPNVKSFYWYSEGSKTSSDVNIGAIDIKGFAGNTDFTSADFYLCGPLGFMRFVSLQLKEIGVPKQNIHFETFGPHDDIV